MGKYGEPPYASCEKEGRKDMVVAAVRTAGCRVRPACTSMAADAAIILGTGSKEGEKEWRHLEKQAELRRRSNIAANPGEQVQLPAQDAQG